MGYAAAAPPLFLRYTLLPVFLDLLFIVGSHTCTLVVATLLFIVAWPWLEGHDRVRLRAEQRLRKLVLHRRSEVAAGVVRARSGVRRQVVPGGGGA